MDALGRILSDVSWDHWVFRVSQNHTPSPRRPSRGWSSPDLRPSSSPRISPLNPKPPCGLLCGFARGLNGPLLGPPCNAQMTEDFAKWTSCKASTADFYRLIEGSPASLPALLHQFLVLSAFPLIGFLNMLFPGHRKFQHDKLFWNLGGNYHVWAETRCCNVLREPHLCYFIKYIMKYNRIWVMDKLQLASSYTWQLMRLIQHVYLNVTINHY